MPLICCTLHAYNIFTLTAMGSYGTRSLDVAEGPHDSLHQLIAQLINNCDKNTSLMQTSHTGIVTLSPTGTFYLAAHFVTGNCRRWYLACIVACHDQRICKLSSVMSVIKKTSTVELCWQHCCAPFAPYHIAPRVEGHYFFGHKASKAALSILVRSKS